MTVMETQGSHGVLLVAIIAATLILGGIFIGAKGLAEENLAVAVIGIGLGLLGVEIMFEELGRPEP